MRKGFFSASKLISKNTTPLAPRCGICGLYKSCNTPKMEPTGKGRRKVLVIAEAPGAEEDRRGVQFVGKAGKHFRSVLNSMQLNLDRDFWKTNAIICRPRENETPTDEMIQCCSPNVAKTIATLQPNVIILLGKPAIDSVLTPIWGGATGKIGRWVGWSIPCQKPNAWIIPMYHPSYLMRIHNKAADILFKKHLKLAISKAKSKPRITKNIKDGIEIIMRPAQAARIIREMIRRGGNVAFDYEGTTLKPELLGAEIVSCSVCWEGKKTIAFPWEGEAIEAVDLLTKSKLGKIASNIKFEDRWTRAAFNHPVRNWIWDTMLAAHTLDNRPDITSIKFQLFVLLGVEPYHRHIEPFLKAVGRTRLNRIKQLDMKDLLLYNGIDSKGEYKVAMKQMKLMEKRNGSRKSR